MTVAALIKLLQALPPRAKVVLAKDGEGNSFSPLADVEACRYEAENSWSGEVKHPDDVPPGKKDNAVALWPTN